MRHNDYGEKNQKGKLLAIMVKGVTGTLGASALMTGAPWYVTLAVLLAGAIANEAINFYKWDK